MASNTNRVIINGIARKISYANDGSLHFWIEVKFESDEKTLVSEHEVHCTKGVSSSIKLQNGDRVTLSGHLAAFKFELFSTIASRTIIVASNIERWD